VALDLSAGPFVRGRGIGKSLNGRVAFDHGTQLIRFGNDLEVDEAAKVVQLLDGHSTEKWRPRQARSNPLMQPTNATGA